MLVFFGGGFGLSESRGFSIGVIARCGRRDLHIALVVTLCRGWLSFFRLRLCSLVIIIALVHLLKFLYFLNHFYHLLHLFDIGILIIGIVVIDYVRRGSIPIRLLIVMGWLVVGMVLRRR